MNIPDQIHFDALDPDDFEFQHWLRTAEAERLWETSTLIAQQLKTEKEQLVHLLRKSRFDLEPCRDKLEKGKALVRMIRDELFARRPNCERRVFKMEASHDIHVLLTSNNRCGWGSRRRKSHDSCV